MVEYYSKNYKCPKCSPNLKTPVIVQGAMYVDKLFHLEKEIKKKYKNDYASIKAARLEKEKPVLEGFWSWFEKQHAVKGSRMEKALTYIQNRRSDMMTYLEDGRCSFCNNLSEIEVKPVALGRKNYQRKPLKSTFHGIRK